MMALTKKHCKRLREKKQSQVTEKESNAKRVGQSGPNDKNTDSLSLSLPLPKTFGSAVVSFLVYQLVRTSEKQETGNKAEKRKEIRTE